MSYEKLGFTSGQTLKAEHLNHMEDGIAKAGGVKSWNELEDKPFYSEMVEGNATFDGDPTGKEFYADNGTALVKMSNRVLTVEELVGSTVVFKYNIAEFGATGDTTESLVITDESVQTVPIDDSSYSIGVSSPLGLPLVMIAKGDVSSMLGMPVTEGTYYVYMEQNGEYLYAESLSCLNGMQEIVHTIDEKYLPNTIAKNSDLSKYAKTSDLDDYAKTSTLSKYVKISDLSSYAKTTDVETLIAEAIGSAIGGSY